MKQNEKDPSLQEQEDGRYDPPWPLFLHPTRLTKNHGQQNQIAIRDDQSHDKDFYLATVVSIQPIFTRDGPLKLNDETLHILLELNDIDNNNRRADIQSSTFTNDDDDDNNTSNVKSKRIKYSINGKGEYAKKYLPAELIKSFIEQNPNLTSSDVIEKWNSLGKFVPHFVENQKDYDIRKDKKTKRTRSVLCGGDMIYVSTRWSKNNAFDNLINAIPDDWNLKVEKLS